MQLYKVIAQLKTVNLRDPAETVKFSQQPGSPHKRLNLSHWAYPMNVNKSQLSTYLLTFNKELPKEKPIFMQCLLQDQHVISSIQNIVTKPI